MNRQDINAVLKPTAHNATMFTVVTGQERQTNILETEFNQLRQRNHRLYIVAKLMYVNALRVSEIIKLRCNQVLADGSIKIETLKGGNNKIIYSDEFSEFFKAYYKGTGSIFADFNRFYIYREFKKCGITEPKGKKKYIKVTHALRHKRALFLQSQGIETKDIKTALSQKSEKSTLHYINKDGK